MKKIAILSTLLAAAAALAAPMAQAQDGRPAPICLQSDRIDRTTVVSPKQINFRMRDGTVYRSDLRTPCSGLRFNGFVYVTPMDEICGAQSIRVLQTHQVCVLGKFTLDHAPSHAG